MAPQKISLVKVMKIVKGIWEMSDQPDPDKRPVLKEVPMTEISPGYFSFPWGIRADVFQKVFVKECGMEAYSNVQKSLDSGNSDQKRPTA